MKGVGGSAGGNAAWPALRNGHITAGRTGRFIQILARQDHFGRISEQAEVENHVSLMLHLGAVTFQGLVARRYS